MKILDFLFKKLFWKPFPADTLGSVGVIISTLLMDNFGWQRADPIASIFIAIMTLISVKPLLTETTQVLLQRSPAELDSKLPQIYQQLATIGLVISVPEIKIHFWTTDMMFHMICNISRHTQVNTKILKTHPWIEIILYIYTILWLSY